MESSSTESKLKPSWRSPTSTRSCGLPESLNRVVRFGVFLADITEWGKMNEVFERVLEKPYPARITVQAVLAQGMRIETDAIALAE